MSKSVMAVLIFHRHELIDIINFGFEALRALATKINLKSSGMECC
jgi:hypothetical protein